VDKIPRFMERVAITDSQSISAKLAWRRRIEEEGLVEGRGAVQIVLQLTP
jgi:hypothetical protein